MAGCRFVAHLVWVTACLATAVVHPVFVLLATAPASSQASAEGAPFNGAPVALPGTIQAESFDHGGPGVAYHDLSPGNSGGQYRATDVDIEQTSDAGGGYNVGWIAPGEWLNYTVDVTAAGTYTLEFRVASLGSGGTFHLEVNGADRTGPLTIPNTGGWQSWTTLTRPGVSLTAGVQVVRVVIDSLGPDAVVGNINWIRVTASGSTGPAPYGGTPVVLPGTIQAENFDEGGSGVAYADSSAGNSGGQYRATDVDIEPTSDAGGGYNVGWAGAGEWLHYSVTVGAAGIYDLDIRVASAGPGGTFRIEVNGVDRTGPVTVPNTGHWQVWTTVGRTAVSLEAGQQSWRLVMLSNGATGAVGNFNWIRVSPGSGAGGAIVRGPYLQQVTDNGAIVVWTTREAGAAEVRYSRSGGPTVAAAATSRLFRASQTGLANDFYQHEARLTGLSPASQYVYDVFMAGVDVTPGRDVFTTAPLRGGGGVRFIAFGDSGVGSAAQHQLAGRMAADSFDLAIHAGDVAYGTASGIGGGSYAQYDEWVFGVYGSWLRSRPFFPSIGNHDDEIAFAQPYRDVFVLPENGASAAYPDHAERYYSFDYGPVHFVALDTERAFLDPARRQAQLAWLEADLSATAQPWRVVYFHRPPYTAGTHHGSDLAVRQAFAPIFEKHRVQLVVAAHEHHYERSTPWREFSQGGAVTYLVTGGGGTTLYPSGLAEWTAASASVHHYVRASVDSCEMVLEAVGLAGTVFDRYSLDRCAQAVDGVPPEVLIASPGSGATVSGTVAVHVQATDDVRVEKVNLYVDGTLKAVTTAAPFVWNLDTRTLSNGSRLLEARAYDIAGRSTRSAPVSVTVANSATSGNVVLYAADVDVVRGNWSRLPSSTGAGGLKMTSEDRGWSSTAVPLAAPADYFEASFDAPAGAYRVWLRLRAAGDSKWNDAVWVQFSDASDAAGAPLWRIGTDRALLVNLEDCYECGVAGWGWQDNAWWLGESSVVRFMAGGRHTIRIQTREDGVDVDQIVLSPATFLTTRPGSLRGDHTIVPK